MNNYKSYIWYECDDSNYWYEDNDKLTVVSYMLGDNNTYTDIQRTCPYGWGTLAKMDAKFMLIDIPDLTINN